MNKHGQTLIIFVIFASSACGYAIYKHNKNTSLRKVLDSIIKQNQLALYPESSNAKIVRNTDLSRVDRSCIVKCSIYVEFSPQVKDDLSKMIARYQQDALLRLRSDSSFLSIANEVNSRDYENDKDTKELSAYDVRWMFNSTFNGTNVIIFSITDVSKDRALDIASLIAEKFIEEAKSYDDTDTFIAATLEDIREEIYGNAEHIREAIKQYSSSIAATNQFAGSAEIRDELYQNVILEEAARSNPLDLLIPMVKASERIIMVGDQRQLPHLLEPKIVDEIVNGDVDKKEKYKESLFGILFNSLAEAKPVRRITLTNQFRMHPVIGDFISKVYYNGAVKSDLVKVESKKHNLSLPWAKDKVAVLCHVPKAAGTEYRKDTSKTRRQEAQRIIRLLDELQTDPAFDNLSIGVITFYSGQVDLINELAEKNGYTEKQADGSYHTAIQYSRTQDGREKLRIGSVDSFQGKEFDVVILSTVRSNEIARVEGNESRVFGFLTLENRLNVAFSRAQKMIILVGDKDMFEDEFAASYVNGLYTFCTELTKGEYGNRIQ